MDIEYTQVLPSAENFEALFDTTGWNKLFNTSSGELDKACRQSWYKLFAYASGQLVGVGRVVSDGVLYAMICDLIVIPAYRQKGIGSEIFHRLVTKCKAADIRQVLLFSAAGRSKFYQKRGFEIRPANAPGMQLRKNDKLHLFRG